MGAEPQSSFLGILIPSPMDLGILHPFPLPISIPSLILFYLLGGLEDTCMIVCLVQALIFKWSQLQDQKVSYSFFLFVFFFEQITVRHCFPMRDK